MVSVDSCSRFRDLILFSFRFTRPVVEGNHSLMGGSADALHLGAAVYFFPFWPLFCLFLSFRVFWGFGFFLYQSLGRVPGLGTKRTASDVTMFLLERCPADRATRVHQIITSLPRIRKWLSRDTEQVNQEKPDETHNVQRPNKNKVLRH